MGPRMPKLITADAYGTLYAPRFSIPKQYNDVTARFGVVIPENQLEKKWLNSYHTVKKMYPNYGKAAGLTVDEFWRKVLVRIYGECQEHPEMIGMIIDKLGKKESYKVFRDFVSLAEWAVWEKEIPFCVASNADSGVTHLVIKEFGMETFLDSQDIYLSYDLELWKPNPEFFNRIIDDQLARLRGIRSTDPNYLEERRKLLQSSWHVGDEYENDVKCAMAAGMGAILVDRSITNPELAIQKRGERFYVVSSLDRVRQIFEK